MGKQNKKRTTPTRLSKPNGNSPKSGAGGILAGPLDVQPTLAGDDGGGGWGMPGPKASSATGQQPKVNPWVIPKASGLTMISQTYPSNYFVEWNPSSWRMACDRVMKQGFTPDYATLVHWVYESSPFVQSMFRTVETAINSTPFYYQDKKGKILPEWTEELCNKPWQIELRREIAFSFFWGFCGLNFDPVEEKLYKYPMQDLDPINRFLRQSTYAFYDGIFFNDHDNLLFVQPNTNYEAFLGWMQPISRMYILMHLNNENWAQAGKRLAFPVFTLGYPEGSDQVNPQTNEVYNPYREEAQEIARDLGPGKTVVFPFVRQPDGELQKNIELDFESPGTSQKAHSIFMDFNEMIKNEIRELILGGTLTADVGNSGSRALGEVQERKLRVFMQSIIEYVVAVHNSEYLRKLSKFYEGGIPEGRFDISRTKQFTIEEIVAWAAVLNGSGQRFTGEFYEAQGLLPEYIEDNPNAAGAKGEQGLTKRDDGRVQELHAIYRQQRAGRRWLS